TRPVKPLALRLLPEPTKPTGCLFPDVLNEFEGGCRGDSVLAGDPRSQIGNAAVSVDRGRFARRRGAADKFFQHRALHDRSPRPWGSHVPLVSCGVTDELVKN